MPRIFSAAGLAVTTLPSAVDHQDSLIEGVDDLSQDTFGAIGFGLVGAHHDVAGGQGGNRHPHDQRFGISRVMGGVHDATRLRRWRADRAAHLLRCATGSARAFAADRR